MSHLDTVHQQPEILPAKAFVLGPELGGQKGSELVQDLWGDCQIAVSELAFHQGNVGRHRSFLRRNVAKLAGDLRIVGAANA
ncbi:MAG: hypothetical protein KGH96_17660 [Sphingomonadales bacterium]|nr:hypothetical protein [Sphingomonadales bacterium]